MFVTISFLSGVGARFPPSKYTDPLVASIQSVLEPLSFKEFDHLSIYMHMPGEPNTFGEPGVTLRLNRSDSELVSRCVLAGDFVREKRSHDARLNAIVSGVIETIRVLFDRYSKSDNEFFIYKTELEYLKNL